MKIAEFQIKNNFIAQLQKGPYVIRCNERLDLCALHIDAETTSHPICALDLNVSEAHPKIIPAVFLWDFNTEYNLFKQLIFVSFEECEGIWEMKSLPTFLTNEKIKEILYFMRFPSKFIS